MTNDIDDLLKGYEYTITIQIANATYDIAQTLVLPVFRTGPAARIYSHSVIVDTSDVRNNINLYVVPMNDTKETPIALTQRYINGAITTIPATDYPAVAAVAADASTHYTYTRKGTYTTQVQIQDNFNTDRTNPVTSGAILWTINDTTLNTNDSRENNLSVQSRLDVTGIPYVVPTGTNILYSSNNSATAPIPGVKYVYTVNGALDPTNTYGPTGTPLVNPNPIKTVEVTIPAVVYTVQYSNDAATNPTAIGSWTNLVAPANLGTETKWIKVTANFKQTPHTNWDVDIVGLDAIRNENDPVAQATAIANWETSHAGFWFEQNEVSPIVVGNTLVRYYAVSNTMTAPDATTIELVSFIGTTPTNTATHIASVNSTNVFNVNSVGSEITAIFMSKNAAITTPTKAQWDAAALNVATNPYKISTLVPAEVEIQPADTKLYVRMMFDQPVIWNPAFTASQISEINANPEQLIKFVASTINTSTQELDDVTISAADSIALEKLISNVYITGFASGATGNNGFIDLEISLLTSGDPDYEETLRMINGSNYIRLVLQNHPTLDIPFFVEMTSKNPIQNDPAKNRVAANRVPDLTADADADANRTGGFMGLAQLTRLDLVVNEAIRSDFDYSVSSLYTNSKYISKEYEFSTTAYVNSGWYTTNGTNKVELLATNFAGSNQYLPIIVNFNFASGSDKLDLSSVNGTQVRFYKNATTPEYVTTDIASVFAGTVTGTGEDAWITPTNSIVAVNDAQKSMVIFIPLNLDANLVDYDDIYVGIKGPKSVESGLVRPYNLSEASTTPMEPFSIDLFEITTVSVRNIDNSKVPFINIGTGAPATLENIENGAGLDVNAPIAVPMTSNKALQFGKPFATANVADLRTFRLWILGTDPDLQKWEEDAAHITANLVYVGTKTSDDTEVEEIVDASSMFSVTRVENTGTNRFEFINHTINSLNDLKDAVVGYQDPVEGKEKRTTTKGITDETYNRHLEIEYVIENAETGRKLKFRVPAVFDLHSPSIVNITADPKGEAGEDILTGYDLTSGWVPTGTSATSIPSNYKFKVRFDAPVIPAAAATATTGENRWNALFNGGYLYLNQAFKYETNPSTTTQQVVTTESSYLFTMAAPTLTPVDSSKVGTGYYEFTYDVVMPTAVQDVVKEVFANWADIAHETDNSTFEMKLYPTTAAAQTVLATAERLPQTTTLYKVLPTERQTQLSKVTYATASDAQSNIATNAAVKDESQYTFKGQPRTFTQYAKVYTNWDETLPITGTTNKYEVVAGTDLSTLKGYYAGAPFKITIEFNSNVAITVGNSAGQNHVDNTYDGTDKFGGDKKFPILISAKAFDDVLAPLGFSIPLSANDPYYTYPSIDVSLTAGTTLEADGYINKLTITLADEANWKTLLNNGEQLTKLLLESIDLTGFGYVTGIASTDTVRFTSVVPEFASRSYIHVQPEPTITSIEFGYKQMIETNSPGVYEVPSDAVFTPFVDNTYFSIPVVTGTTASATTTTGINFNAGTTETQHAMPIFKVTFTEDIAKVTTNSTTRIIADIGTQSIVFQLPNSNGYVVDNEYYLPAIRIFITEDGYSESGFDGTKNILVGST